MPIGSWSFPYHLPFPSKKKSGDEAGPTPAKASGESSSVSVQLPHQRQANGDDAENLVRCATSHLRRDSNSTAHAAPVHHAAEPTSPASTVSPAQQQCSQGPIATHSIRPIAQTYGPNISSGVASLRSSSTGHSHTSVEECTDTSETESVTSAFSAEPSETPGSLPPPFLYPVPQDAIPHVTNPASGYATPLVQTSPVPHISATSFVSTPHLLRSPGAPLAVSTAGLRVSSHAMGMQPSVPPGQAGHVRSSSHETNEQSQLAPHATAQETFVSPYLSPMHQQKLQEYHQTTMPSPLTLHSPLEQQQQSSSSASLLLPPSSTRAQPPNQDYDEIPPTPTEIMTRRSSKMGAPALWMTSQAATPNGSATPTVVCSQLGTPGFTPSPSSRWNALGMGRGRLGTSVMTPIDAPAPNDAPMCSEPLEHQDRKRLASAPETIDESQVSQPLWQRRLQRNEKPFINLAPVTTTHRGKGTESDAGELDHTNIMLAHATQALNCLALEQERALVAEEGRRNMSLLGANRHSLTLMGSEPPKDGEEELPPYECTVHIEGYLPCNMEVHGSGDSSKMHDWKSLYFVLHGTALHLYKKDISLLYSKRASLINVWHVQDGALVHTVPLNEEPHVNEMSSGRNQKHDEKAHTNPLPLEDLVLRGIELGRSLAHTTSDATQTRTENVEKELDEVQRALKDHHVHTYSMEGAQCGFAADYTKRPHVIRIKVASDQFLIQTRNNYHLVDWIEALQGSINVSTDLDRRTMPKFVTLPRRRRRRRDMEAMVIRDQNAEQHRRPSIQSPPSIGNSHLNSYAQSLQV